MATIRYGSTANGGKPIWTVPKPISPVDLNATPPIPPAMPTKATIASFQTPVQIGQPSRAVAKVTQGKADQFRWSWYDGHTWHVGAVNNATDTDHSFNRSNPPWDNVFPARTGGFDIRLETLVGGHVVDTTGTKRTIQVIAQPTPPDPTPIPPDPIPPQPTPGPLQKVHAPAGSHYFVTEDGQAWRWKGVSAFQLLDRWVRGENVQPFLDAYRGFNLLRVWPYVPVRDWGSSAWDSPSPAQAVAFVQAMNAIGWYVEFTCLTDNDPARVPQAKAFITAFKAVGLQGYLFLEAGNEPEVQKPGNNYDTSVLKADLQAWGGEYASGNYTDGAARWYGTYLTCHTSRDAEWPRRCHDGYDYWVKPADAPPGAQAVHAPIVFDEPAKLEDVSGNRSQDWRAYFGGGSFFGAGLTFHSQTGKYAQLPTDQEKQLIANALAGMNAFPATASAGAYTRIDDHTLRTYIVGNASVRIRPTTPNHPQAGWTAIDADGILWRR